MSTQIHYSARIGLPVRQYVMGAVEAARKPILQPRTRKHGNELQNTDGLPWNSEIPWFSEKFGHLYCGSNDEIECTFRAKVEEDPHYRNIIRYLQIGEVHLLRAIEQRRLRVMARKYRLQNDELYYRDADGELKLCLAQFEVPAVLTEFHNSAFGGYWG